MFCKKCGKEIQDGNTFCTNCGSKVEEKKKIIKKENKVIKIKVYYLIIAILLITIILSLIFVAKVKRNNINSDDNSMSNNLTLDNSSNYILDVVDETNKEFKINGMAFLEELVRVYEVNMEYKYDGTDNGIKSYKVGYHILSLPRPEIGHSGVTYPAIIVGINEKTDNLAIICIGIPYNYAGNINSMVEGNYSHVEKALKNLGHYELWNSIKTIKSSLETNQQDKYSKSGVNGVCFDYVEASSDGSYGINYLRFMTKDLKEYKNHNTSENTNNEELNVSGENDKYAGVGMFFAQNENNEVYVEGTMDNQPAEEAGILKNDIIVSIDNVPVVGMSIEDIANKLKGKEGTKVLVKVKRNEQEKEFTVTRKIIDVPIIRSNMLDNNLGYIHIHSFEKDTFTEFEQAMDKLVNQNTDKVILDLRNSTNQVGIDTDTTKKMEELNL